MKCERIPLKQVLKTHSLVSDYNDQSDRLSHLISRFPSIDSIIDQSREKQFSAESRQLLHDRLVEQYGNLELNSAVESNLKALLEDKTYTITTGHQLCLNTGPMYLIYKIVSVIALTRELNNSQSEYNYVPVFWMATEDHDFDEMNHFRVFGETYSWHTNQSGAVGRMNTSGITAILNDVKEAFKTNESLVAWWQKIDESLEYDRLSMAYRAMIHALFGEYGLVVIDGDDVEFKRSFSQVMRQDLATPAISHSLRNTTSWLEENGYKIQVKARETNLFYLESDERLRLDRSGNEFSLLGKAGSSDVNHWLNTLERNPESFSPNVVLRPMYQESILPNVVYIGGGGEISYWLELKESFERANVQFPILLQRDSALFIKKKSWEFIRKHGISLQAFQGRVEDLEAAWLNEVSIPSLDTESEDIMKAMDEVLNKLIDTDPNLKGAVEAERSKIQKGFTNLENKLRKSVKRQQEVDIQRLKKIKDELFPSGVFQERRVNAIQILLTFDINLIELLLDHFDPLDNQLKVFIG